MSSWNTAPSVPGSAPSATPAFGAGPAPTGLPSAPAGLPSAAPLAGGLPSAQPLGVPSASTLPTGPGLPTGPSLPQAGMVTLPGAASRSSVSAGDLTVASAPSWILFVALALALVAGILAGWLGGTPWLAIVAWVIAGPLAMAVIAYFSFADTKVRARGLYNDQALAKILYWVAIVLSFAATLIAAWRIGDWVGHL